MSEATKALESTKLSKTSEATEALESSSKTIRNQALSDIQTIFKGFMLAKKNLDATKERYSLGINSKKRVVGVIKEVDVLGLLYSQRIMCFIEDLNELLPDNSTFMANQEFLVFLLRLHKVSNYRKLNVGQKAFLKAKIGALDASYQASELVRNNFDALVLVYTIALEEENFDFEMINANIGDLLLVANIYGTDTPKSKVQENIRSAVKDVLAGRSIDFDAYYDPEKLLVPKRRIESEGIVKKYLFIKLLAHNPKKDWRRALEVVKQYLGEEGIQTLTQKDLKRFLQFKSSDSNQKLIRKRPSDERINKVFDEFRLV